MKNKNLPAGRQDKKFINLFLVILITLVFSFPQVIIAQDGGDEGGEYEQELERLGLEYM